MDAADRHWTVSVSSSFASLVTAVEWLTDPGEAHWLYCEQCREKQLHEVPGAGTRFRSFFETCAPADPLRERRRQMYKLRWDILHGSDLMQMDQDWLSGWTRQTSTKESFIASFGASRALRCAIG
jgi:hypothetical protein